MANKLRFLLTGDRGRSSASRSSRARSCSPTTIKKTFDELFSDIYEDTDAVVRAAAQTFKGDFGAGRGRIARACCRRCAGAPA